MKYYLIAGEASGDLHASSLVRELKKLDPAAEVRCWGGDLLSAAGATVVKHYRDLAFMGFVEVLTNLQTILRNFDFCKKDILSFQPDAVILVDYPGFNLRMAEFAHKAGLKVFYYISPQVWAWKQSRVKKIRKFVDKMMVILPFEKEFYARHQVTVEFVGHPLLDAIASFAPDPAFRQSAGLDERSVIALLPGSREQEVKKMLGIMLTMVPVYPGCQFVVAAAASLPLEFYEKVTTGMDVKVVSGKTYDLLSISTAALVTSGTATLETALFRVPEVVCYKGGRISYEIARRIIHVPYISLVNLVLEKEAVKELIQADFTPDRLRRELDLILDDTLNRKRLLIDYKELATKLGNSGASAKAAGLVFQTLRKNPRQIP